MVSNCRVIKFITVLCFCFTASSLFAQYHEQPNRWVDKSLWSRNLLNLKIGDKIGNFYNCDMNDYSVLASSWLEPEGEKYSVVNDLNDFAIWTNYYWTVTYDPFKAYDNNLSTAWSEGVEGDGIGEVLIYPLCDSDRIENENLRIFTGYAKSKDLWLKNNRPRNIKIFILKSTEHSWNKNTSFPMDITVVDEQYATLKDVFDWQPLPIEKSKITFENRKKASDESLEKEEMRKYWDSREEYFVGIQILSVYPGTKYKDTLISEISYDNEENPGNYYGYVHSILADPRHY